MSNKLDKLITLCKHLIQGLFTGNIVIHFNRGAICKIEKHETINI